MGRAFFPRSLLPQLNPAVCVSTEAFAFWQRDELDIGLVDGCRTFVRLVGAHSPRPSLVGLGGKESRSPCRRHGALSARAPSDLFGPDPCRFRNRYGERNLIRAAGRRDHNLGLLHQSATRGTLLARCTRRERL